MISIAEEEQDDEQLSLLLSHRSACHFAIKEFQCKSTLSVFVLMTF